MPKDDEKIFPPDPSLIMPSGAQPFSAEQMIRCEECLRANPPTRINCLYCAAVLPVATNSARLQKAGLRRLEKWENGFNTILIPGTRRTLSDDELNEVANLLKLSPEQVLRILSTHGPSPLSRAASEDEAALIFRRLSELGLNILTLPDQLLRLDDREVVRIRSATVQSDKIIGYQSAKAAAFSFSFDQLILLVLGRLFVKRVEVKERKTRSAENDIVDASEFFADEAVLDIYGGPESQPWRVEAGSFDFSVLGPRKDLIAERNLVALTHLIRGHAPQAELDNSYPTMRQILDPVWPTQQRTESSGWHRERPGKYITGGVTASSNENQFTRYSRMQYYLKLHPPGQQ